MIIEMLFDSDKEVEDFLEDYRKLLEKHEVRNINHVIVNGVECIESDGMYRSATLSSKMCGWLFYSLILYNFEEYAESNFHKFWNIFTATYCSGLYPGGCIFVITTKETSKGDYVNDIRLRNGHDKILEINTVTENHFMIASLIINSYYDKKKIRDVLGILNNE